MLRAKPGTLSQQLIPLALATFHVLLSAPTWALLGNPSSSHLARPHWLITKLPIPVPDKVSLHPLHGIVVSGFFVCVPQSTPLLEQSAICWGFRQQAFISHSSGGWESRVLEVSMLRVWYEPISWPTDGHLLTVCPYGFSSQCAFGESSVFLFLEGHQSQSHHGLPPSQAHLNLIACKGPASRHCHIVGLGLQHMDFAVDRNISL